MSIAALSKIEITDEDIDKIELLLGNIKFDEQRRNIIKFLDSVDIQAFPGSGKTTVLIAKLAILAQKWPYTDKGICVLSHTNVARDEIERRLGNTNAGKRLLSYPHFIGTVHSFFDTFVGLPWLRSNGYPITLIDTEFVLERRLHKLKYGTQKYLMHRKLPNTTCESKSFPISIDAKCKDTSPSYKDIFNCVDASFKDGYFTFDEILHVSEYAIGQCSYLPSAIQKRFPVLFIDEAQDTSSVQWQLINSSFPDSNCSVRQSFGDANQAIFQSYNSTDTSNVFPSKEYLTISNSHRFGQSIAYLADSLGIIAQGLTGELSKYNRLDRTHTIFLFDDASLVLPAYSEYLLKCFTDDELKGDLSCHAVGMVHNKDMVDINDAKYPVGIKDYWTTYDPEASKLVYKPRFCIEYFRAGQRAFIQSGDYHQFVDCVADSLRKYIRLNTKLCIPNAKTAFNAIVKMVPKQLENSFRSNMSELLEFPIETQEEWKIVVKMIRNILKSYFHIQYFTTDFFNWIDANELIPTITYTENTDKNTYNYTSPESGRSVSVHLSSIHAVKGRTHLATLVLDTYWYGRNIKSILPWLCNKPTKRKLGTRDITRLKCHYVALTRARGLICIAVSKSSVNEAEKKMLTDVGWNIIEL